MSESILEIRCAELGLKMTGQRKVIARVLSDSSDHPDVEELYSRASKVDAKISLATVYRTLRLFEDVNLLMRHDFGDGRARYEIRTREHHDHLVDVESGKVIEFVSKEIEAVQEKIAKQYGYKLVAHRVELFGIPIPAEKGSRGEG